MLEKQKLTKQQHEITVTKILDERGVWVNIDWRRDER